MFVVKNYGIRRGFAGGRRLTAKILKWSYVLVDKNDCIRRVGGGGQRRLLGFPNGARFSLLKHIVYDESLVAHSDRLMGF